MNSSKLYEWLLDNDCPFEWEVDDVHDELTSVKLKFTEPNSFSTLYYNDKVRS